MCFGEALCERNQGGVRYVHRYVVILTHQLLHPQKVPLREGMNLQATVEDELPELRLSNQPRSRPRKWSASVRHGIVVTMGGESPGSAAAHRAWC
jgi:hypothetical protein